MGKVCPPSPDASAAIFEGLEAARRAERRRMSRVLHDQIGPSLCSAGLMVGLLRSAPDEFPLQTNEMLASIQDALETTIDSIRALSYAADPALASRCGFHSALSYVARWHDCELKLASRPMVLDGASAEAACRILNDALLLLPPDRLHPERLLDVGPSSLTLTAAGRLDGAAFDALAHCAASAALGLKRSASGALLRLTLRRAGGCA